MNNSIQAIVLAGGKSTRFHTGRSKLIEKICGRELILFPIELLESLSIPTTILVGWQKDIVQDLVVQSYGQGIQFITQEEQRGTGHAVLCTQSTWQSEHILVLNGDMPLVKASTITLLIKQHLKNDAAVSFVTAHHNDPSSGYGRVVEENERIRIVEAKDFTGNTQEHCCINAGIYLFKRSFLEESISQLQTNNNAHELYLTDLIGIASNQSLMVQMVQVGFDEVRGVNTLKELWTAEQIIRAELISRHMDNGVRFQAPHTTHIECNVIIKPGTLIGAGVHLTNNTHIGADCIVEPFSLLSNANLHDKVHIKSHSIINDSTIEKESIVGPFALIESESIIGQESIIGNFVQVKRSSMGSGNKAKHFAYLGDTAMGNDNNIGAGTITCNYDGKNKHKTIIKNKCFVGSNNTLVAPLTLENNAYTAAGSTITQDVPSDSLAIGRARQVTKEGYLAKRQLLKSVKEPLHEY